jgi:hypothetical protein
MTMVISCPQCRQSLQVAPQQLGTWVECPECKHPFTAAAAKPPSVGPPSVPADEELREEDEEFERPLEERQETKKPRKRKRELSRFGTTTGGFYSDLMKDQRRSQSPHRGVSVLLLGIFSILCSAGPIVGIGACLCGIYAYQMGSVDLNEMLRGRMDPSGKLMTQIGRITGVIGACLSVPFILGSFCLLVATLIRAFGPMDR